MRVLQDLFRRDRTVDPKARLAELRYVVFDTEFTSLEAKSNRLLSIGAVGMEGAKIRVGEQFYRVTNPGVDVPGKSVVVHRLRPEDVSRAEAPEAVLEDFVKFAAGAVMVGHFVQYDVEIVNKELGKRRVGPAEGGRANIGDASIDTAQVHRWLEKHRGGYAAEAFDERTIKMDLASVAEHYAVSFEEAHHALADAFVTAQVWQKQIAALAGRGVRTWRELRAVAA